MKISSYELAHFSKYMLNELQKIHEKINFYSNEEVKKWKQSNFSLEISEQDAISLSKFDKVLSEKENITIDSDSVKSLREKYDEAPQKFNEFDQLCDKIFSSQNGSLDQAFFYTPFSRWFEECYSIIRDLYLQFLDRLEIKDIIANKQQYESILKNAKSRDDELQQILNKTKLKSDELLLKLEQNVSEHEIADIKHYYLQMMDITRKEKNINCTFFYSFSCLLIILLTLIFIFMGKIYLNNYLLIPKSILSCTLIGFISFLINDFRKRFNITKNILDELKQKEIVVDTYSSLQARIKDFDEETKKKYHEKIIQNIIDTLLLIRNHGYLSKSFNQSTPDYAMKIIEKLGNIISVKK